MLPMLGDFGAPWEITRNYFRLYACCNPIHPALDALHAVVAQLQPRPEEVERIDVTTYKFAAVMNNPAPPNFFASKYSLPHACAVLIVRGELGHAALDDTALADATIASLRWEREDRSRCPMERRCATSPARRSCRA